MAKQVIYVNFELPQLAKDVLGQYATLRLVPITAEPPLLTFTTQTKIIDDALKDNYRRTMERKRVPVDYLLAHTEGGEAGAVAGSIAIAQRAACIEWYRYPPKIARE